MSFAKLRANAITLFFQALQLFIITLDANLLSAAQTVAMLLAWQHGKVMYTKAVLRYVSNTLSHGLQVSKRDRCIDLDFLKHATQSGLSS
ncbi:hypothetical protein D3C86_1943210 [compost metagenome]